jgi:tetratricopeptide (TPR) repeat protein
VGREALARAELARRVFSDTFRSRTPLPLPIHVFAVSSARFMAVRPGQNTRGFYQSAPERDYIVLDASSPLSRVVFHEFVHLVLHHTSGPLPRWLEEGLAEFHSTLEAAEGKLRIGLPIDAHLRILAARPWLSGEQIAQVTKDSPYYNEADRSGVFYAQSWALVHMLRLDEDYRSGFAEFLSLLDRGQPPAAAFQQAFGKSLSEAVTDLKTYLGRTGLPVLEMEATLDPAPPAAVLAEFSDWDGELAFAELALACGQPREAEKIQRRLSQKPLDNAGTVAALGMLALARKQTGEARRYLELAMKLPDPPADVYFEYAMLLRDQSAAPDTVRPYLEKAVRINPRYAEAHFLLGFYEAAADRHREAVTHLEQAASIFPRQSYFWHALALSYHALGRREQARSAAVRALDSAATTEQAEMARGALRTVEAPFPPSAARKPGVHTPESWRNPQGDARIEGILDRIDCLGATARFVIRSGAKSVALLVEKPGEVLLKNLTSVTFEFRCGPQKPRPVVVEYQTREDRATATAGVVTSLEIR